VERFARFWLQGGGGGGGGAFDVVPPALASLNVIGFVSTDRNCLAPASILRRGPFGLPPPTLDPFGLVFRRLAFPAAGVRATPREASSIGIGSLFCKELVTVLPDCHSSARHRTNASAPPIPVTKIYVTHIKHGRKWCHAFED